MIELDLKLKVPEKLIKKIKAYAVLVDQKPAEFVEYFTSDILASKLNDMIEALIRGELDGEDTSFTTAGKLAETTSEKGVWKGSVASEITADQGAELHDDEDLYQQALEEEADILDMSKVSGVSASELEHDLEVDDPEHEAAVIAEEFQNTQSSIADEYSTKDLDKREAILREKEDNDLGSFAQRMGIDLGNIEPHIVGRTKRNPDLGRGNVSTFGVNASERSSF